MRGITIVVALAVTATSPQNAAGPPPCEAFGAADAVFIGEAGAPVQRPVPQHDKRKVNVVFSPVVVERAVRGVSTPVVYITPAGLPTLLTPGQRYLIYGRHYAGTDMFMSSAMYGTKLVSDASQDLEFFDLIAANYHGAAISGVLELDESDAAARDSQLTPLANVRIQLSVGDRKVETITAADGSFNAAGLAAGTYTAQAILPDDLVLDDDEPLSTVVQERGCASLHLRAIPNGRIVGTLRARDGRPAIGEEVSLLPAGLRADEPDRYFQAVRVKSDGRFAFAGVRPGQYVVGRLAITLDGERLPAVYYPGTSDRRAATVIVVDRSGTRDVGDFALDR